MRSGYFYEPMLVVGGTIAFSCLTPHFLFNKCPHCGKQLGRNEGEFCQFCGRHIDCSCSGRCGVACERSLADERGSQTFIRIENGGIAWNCQKLMKKNCLLSKKIIDEINYFVVDENCDEESPEVKKLAQKLREVTGKEELSIDPFLYYSSYTTLEVTIVKKKLSIIPVMMVTKRQWSYVRWVREGFGQDIRERG